MFSKLSGYLVKPLIYASSTGKFWDDEHISKGMLKAHLDPEWDAATRKLDFVDKSIEWIASAAPPSQYRQLLDLGCGPGIYAERFGKAGFLVTGIDFSLRSVNYAIEQSKANQSNIQYLHKNYLSIEYKSCFDVATLIYCDFGVLPEGDRTALLRKIYESLRPGGKFIFDVFTPLEHKNKQEKSDWKYYSNGGFWDYRPHLCLNSFYRYDEDDTVLNRTIVINEHNMNCYHIWEHCFTESNLLKETQKAGFKHYELYDDISGKRYSGNGNIICAVLTK